MPALPPKRREFANPANLARLLQPLPRRLREQVAADYQFDKWAQKVTFEPYFRMHLLLSLTRYETLHQLQEAMAEDPLFALHGARMEVSVSALARVPKQRGSGAFEELLAVVLDAVAELPHASRRARALTTATLASIQELLVRTQIVDSSTFSLPPTVAEWAKTRENAAGFKLHLRLSGGYGGISQVEFSPAKEHDRRHLDALIEGAQEGEIFLFDRGYQDFGLFERLTDRKVLFVSKLKRGCTIEEVERQEIGEITPSGYVVLRERRVRLGAGDKQTQNEYRLLEVLTPEGEKATLVTNAWDLTAAQVCALYRYRWTIEILFRWLKHTLGLKHLISTNRAGVTIQVVMALLVYSLLVLYQEGEQNWTPRRWLMKTQFLLHWTLIEYGYWLAHAQLRGSPDDFA
jgi:IS5 family transposase